MDQTPPKSVWLRLILPICLGVFATAIYHNAIKTQKTQFDGFVATKKMKSGEIKPAQWSDSFKRLSVTVHKESPKSLKQLFEAGGIEQKRRGLTVTLNRDVNEGENISIHDLTYTQEPG